jgi:TonB family protein
MQLVQCCLALLIFTRITLLAQTDPSSLPSAGPPSSASGQSGQTAPPGAPGSTQASSNPGDSIRLVIVKLQKPEYPIAANNQQIQGQVWVHLVITETGDVESAEAISGNPLLADATVKAMKQWKFKPYIRNGHPVRVSTKLSYDFAFKGKVEDVTEGANPSPEKVNSNPLPQPSSPTSTASPGTTATSPSATSSNSLQRIVIAQGVLQGMLIHKVVPIYPESAQKAHSRYGRIASCNRKGRTNQEPASDLRPSGTG